ncbi:MAG TPA: UDP-N-acetylmuramoyl-L-alanine--D-glutamate ligase [Chitinophagaceae bacterium]|nr:UDP-N-acetylmuramoyl-L-alanine--D-glutamate ligase [Chitinophagaceae bacterium]
MKKIIILGAGESGIGAALLAKQQGYNVFVSDGGAIKEIYKAELIDNNISFEENKHTEEKILEADEIVKSPGIPEKNELIQKIRKKGIPIISEIEFAYRYKGNSKIIAITGSNGKSTATALIYHICKIAALDCALVGNIGYSFAKQIAENPKPLYVLEISSFQLDDITTFKPDVAVLLNITEDHLDRYNYQFENYIQSKFRVAKNQSNKDIFIYCMDDEIIMANISKHNILAIKYPFTMKQPISIGAYIQNNNMKIITHTEESEMSVNDFALKGKHNQYNTMAAGIAASSIGVRKEKIREAVTTFQSLEHRMENIISIRGVQFINDSKATNINSTWYALESMERPTILILGGVDKGNDYNLIKDLVKEKVKAIVCLGKDNIKIHKAFGNIVSTIVNTESAEAAAQEAFRLSKKGDTVLLSPACASFDLFKNYEDRGRQFKKAVKEL